MALTWQVGTMKNCTCNRTTGEVTAQTTDGSKSIITAKNGYYFYDNDYTFQYYRYENNIKTGHFTISQDKTTLTGVLGSPRDYLYIIIPNITATLPVQDYKYIIGDLTNCTCNKSNDDTVVSGDVITVTANDGYYFIDGDGTDKITIGDNKYSFAVSNDGSKMTFTITDNRYIGNVTISTISATVKPIIYKYVIGELNNCTCNKSNGDTVVNGDVITVTANDGYYFIDGDGTDKINIDGNTYDFTISDNSLTMNFVITDTTYKGDITINTISATKKPIEPTIYKYTVGTMTNCTCNITNEQVVKIGDKITITANSGYNFTNDDRFNLTINNESYAFTLSNDSKILSFTLSEKNYTSGDIVIGSIKATLTPATTTTNFLNIYLPTNDELNLLAKQRFIDIAQDSKFDYGNYILQLYRCYIPISDKYKENSTIHLANSDTEISCITIKNNIFDIECNINISNLLYDTDYSAYLYIPNSNTYINVDISHIFNKTLHIKLSYELYSNKCQYSLFDENVMFDCGVFTFGSNIPFRFYNSIAQTDYNYNPPIKDCCYLMVIGDTISKVSDIDFEFINGDILDIDNSDINDNDYSEIIQLFNSGIYI